MNGCSRRLLIIVSVLLGLATSQAAAAAALPQDSVYNLTPRWTAQDGRDLTLAELQGRPVVLAMIYTNCADTCPLIIQNMLNIHDEIPASVRRHTLFALVSFDSARDTPAHLKAYAAGLHLDPEEWILLHGDENAVRGLAAVLGVKFRRKPDGDYDHSVVISLLDPEGRIAFQQNGIEGHSRGLESRLAALAGP